jgi:hypothetical protein
MQARRKKLRRSKPGRFIAILLFVYTAPMTIQRHQAGRT